MKKLNLSRVSSIVTLILIALFLISCAVDKVVIKTGDKVDKTRGLERTDARIVKVYDNRYSSTEIINPESTGFTLSGFPRQEVPLVLDKPVTDYLESKINRMISSDSKLDSYVPITVSMDTFRVNVNSFLFGESANFKCAMNFSYPVTEDSFNIISTYSLQEINMINGVTHLLGNIIYEGVSHCTEQFLAKYDSSMKYHIKSEQTISKFIEEKKVSDKAKYDVFMNSEPVSNSFISLEASYLSGSKIIPGYSVYISSFTYRKNWQYFVGNGFEFCYFNVNNDKDKINGKLWGFGGKITPKYFLSKSYQGLFLEGGFTLLLAWEKYGNYSSSREFKIILGPKIEESVGLKLGPLFIEAGSYQIALLWSDLLPWDFGYKLSAGMQF